MHGGLLFWGALDNIEFGIDISVYSFRRHWHKVISSLVPTVWPPILISVVVKTLLGLKTKTETCKFHIIKEERNASTMECKNNFSRRLQAVITKPEPESSSAKFSVKYAEGPMICDVFSKK